MKKRVSFLFVFIAALVSAKEQPNILILFLDDLDPDFGCYGNPYTTTPNIDRLAEEGELYTRAYASAPVCNPSHTSLFTGCYVSSIGAVHHRSSYVDNLPDGYTILTELMKDGGYFTVNFKSNGDRMYNKIYGATAKTDLNFDRGEPENNQESGKEVFEHLQVIDPNDISTYFEGGSWGQKKDGQAFFAYANIETGKKHGFYLGREWAEERGISVKPSEVEIPPYYADTEEVRDILAASQDAVSRTDFEVGKFLDALEKAGYKDNTLVFLLSDHGATLPRHKQCLWSTGIHIPLIIRWPGQIDSGGKSDELASIVDLAPTCLEAAGLNVPENMDGIDLMDKSLLAERPYVFATRDGMNNYFDCSRTVVGRRYQYIHHFYPELPFLSNSYARSALNFKSMQQMHKEEKLNGLQSVYFDELKPDCELYDLEGDSDLTRNLAVYLENESLVAEFRKALFQWQEKSGDRILDAREILGVTKVPLGTKVDDLLKGRSSR